MPVVRPEVRKAKFLENHPPAAPGNEEVEYKVLDLLVEPAREAFHAEDPGNHAAQGTVQCTRRSLGADIREVAGDRAHVGVDAHSIVVEDDQEAALCQVDVVDSRKSQAAGQSAVSDDGKRPGVVAGVVQTQRSRNWCAGMAGAGTGGEGCRR